MSEQDSWFIGKLVLFLKEEPSDKLIPNEDPEICVEENPGQYGMGKCVDVIGDTLVILEGGDGKAILFTGGKYERGPVFYKIPSENRSKQTDLYSILAYQDMEAFISQRVKPIASSCGM